jgi:hypothetical protein
MNFQEAMKAFDIAFMFTDGDSKTTHFLLLVKVCQFLLICPLLHYGFQAIALFNANQHDEAMLRVEELLSACPNADILACSVVKVSIMYSIKPGLRVNTDFRTSNIRRTYTSNSESMRRILTKLLSTSLLLSKASLSHLNQQFTLNMKSSLR